MTDNSSAETPHTMVLNHVLPVDVQVVRRNEPALLAHLHELGHVSLERREVQNLCNVVIVSIKLSSSCYKLSARVAQLMLKLPSNQLYTLYWNLSVASGPTQSIPIIPMITIDSARKEQKE